MDHKLRKSERLSSRKRLDILMKEGQSVYQFPLRIVWRLTEKTDTGFPVHVAFSVPKRRHKRAVIRNGIRRRMKEIYRMNKQIWYDKLKTMNKEADLMFIYTADSLLPFKEMRDRQVSLMKKIEKRLDEKGVEIHT